MSTLRWLLTVGLAVTVGAGCGAITGEPLGGTGGNGAGGNGSGGAATGGKGAGGTATGGIGAGGSGGGCVCNALYDPVCGVDGVTYGNSCAANCLGIPIAYQGACVDGGAGACNSDNDCVFESSGCCGQACVARGAPPLLIPPLICNVSCPIEVAETCGCVNHQCVTETGAGGAGGAGGFGGVGGVGGAGGAGGANCGDLAREYADALPNAEQCAVNAKSQCLQSVSASLSPCNDNCTTYVNDATTLNAIQASWLQLGCNNVAVACPAIACLQPVGGQCVIGDGGGGRCQPVTGGITN